MKISYGKNVYNNEEISAVVSQLKKTTQMSKSVKTFEKKISKLFDKNYALMVNSGTSAITLALDVLNIKKNSEIIVPSLNFGTAISCIIRANLKPIFVDIDPNTLQIDCNLIEKKISKKTKALMIPNLIGNLPELDRLKNLCKKHKLYLIEDSADTLGSKFNKKSSGFYSDVSICSFYGSHVISCAGNGGILCFNDKKFLQRATVLRSWGRSSSILKQSENINQRLNIKLKGFEYDKKFVFQELGYNFEPSEIGAAFGLIQLKKLKKFVNIRRKNFNHHQKFFTKYKKYFSVVKVNKKIQTNFLAYPILIKQSNNFSRKDLQKYLEKKQIQTRPIFSGNILRHPAFSNLKSKVNDVEKHKNSDYVMKYGLLVGMHQGLHKKHINYIHKNIEKFLINKK